MCLWLKKKQFARRALYFVNIMTIKPASSWYVYILSCNDGSLYTGITTDLYRRVAEHNSSVKGAKYTKARRPVRLVYHETAISRSAAAKREYKLKKMSTRQKHSLVKRFEISD